MDDPATLLAEPTEENTGLTWPRVFFDIALMVGLSAAVLALTWWMKQPPEVHITSYLLTPLPAPAIAQQAAPKILVYFMAFMALIVVAIGAGRPVGNALCICALCVLGYGINEYSNYSNEKARQQQAIEDQIFAQGMSQGYATLPVRGGYYKGGKHGPYYWAALQPQGALPITEAAYTELSRSQFQNKIGPNGPYVSLNVKRGTPHCLHVIVDSAGDYRRVRIDSAKRFDLGDLVAC